MITALKSGAAALVLCGIVWGAHALLEARYDAGYVAGQDSVESAVTAAREEDSKEKAALGTERNAAVAQAHEDFAVEREQLQRVIDEKATAARDRDALIARLRATAARAAAGGLVANQRTDPAAATGAAELRLQACYGLLREGQGLLIEAGAMAGEGGDVVDEGVDLLGRSDALIKLARRWGAAARIGASP